MSAWGRKGQARANEEKNGIREGEGAPTHGVSKGGLVIPAVLVWKRRSE